MQLTTTARGFAVLNFTDYNQVPCSLQASSLATENCIWLGCDSANVEVSISGRGWQSFKLPEAHLATTRMHLTRQQVKELLPYLIRFAETGELL